jgi:hypothetical protein
MSSSDRNRSSGLMLSLPAILAILLGGGTLFVCWKFDYLFYELSETERILIYGGGIAALVWGVARAFTDIPVALPRRLQFGLHRVSLPRTGQFYLVIMILIFSGSLLGRSNMLMLVFSMMAGPFVINGWITYSMLKRTAVERIVPARVMAGEPMTIELVLANRKRLMSCWLMARSNSSQACCSRGSPPESGNRDTIRCVSIAEDVIAWDPPGSPRGFRSGSLSADCCSPCRARSWCIRGWGDFPPGGCENTFLRPIWSSAASCGRGPSTTSSTASASIVGATIRGPSTGAVPPATTH